MLAMMRSEWMKIRRSIVWLLVPISPLLALPAGLLGTSATDGAPWQEALALLAVLHAMLFLPLLTCVFAAMVCRYEHLNGGWKQLLALPVSRTSVYAAKLAVILLLLALVQLLFLLALLMVGILGGFAPPIPWGALLSSVLGGWIACLPLAALQLFASTLFQSFAAPVAAGVVFTMPNMLIANSAQYGPYYPWVQPMLAMIPREHMAFGAFGITSGTLLAVIGVSFAAFFLVGWTYFSRKAV
ncbi:ABC transporter permease [Paenibacillus daejeonensis]|uniref:ABC transporter permease n=1 Tax=Paenibacillus daejeonensis TaxID=135193 RepID=UPI00037AEDBA|nr:ABC transporter permease [Paenibacillus daejeonensis]